MNGKTRTGLENFFEPKTVAVIGANKEPGKIGNSIFKDLLKKFHGQTFPVNPNTDEVLGQKSFKTIVDVPLPVDLAVVVVPAAVVPQVMLDCAKKKVKAAVIISSGFAEVGNKKLEEKLEKVVSKSRIPTCGPNCLGVFNPETGVDTLFLPAERLKRPAPGGIGFITQSGAVGSVILDLLADEGYGVSKFVSFGNAVDANEVDFLEYFGNDEKTRVICLYLEGTKHGKQLVDVARRISKKKPIIAIKAGRTAEGTHAVSSHTGSLAGSFEVYDAAFKQAGIIRADDAYEMFDFAEALSSQPPAAGNRICIVTNGGGFGVLATDAAIMNGLSLAQLSAGTKKQVKKAIPPYVNATVPIDLSGDADAARYEAVLDAVGKDKNVDVVLCIALFQTVSLEPRVIDVLLNFSAKKLKPIIVCSAGGKYTRDMVLKLEQHGVPVFDSPFMAARAAWSLVKYGQILKK